MSWGEKVEGVKEVVRSGGVPKPGPGDFVVGPFHLFHGCVDAF
jgi:hypothetical protein